MPLPPVSVRRHARGRPDGRLLRPDRHFRQSSEMCRMPMKTVCPLSRVRQPRPVEFTESDNMPAPQLIDLPVQRRCQRQRVRRSSSSMRATAGSTVTGAYVIDNSSKPVTVAHAGADAAAMLTETANRAGGPGAGGGRRYRSAARDVILTGADSRELERRERTSATWRRTHCVWYARELHRRLQ